jgi:hypothetical protein
MDPSCFLLLIGSLPDSQHLRLSSVKEARPRCPRWRCGPLSISGSPAYAPVLRPNVPPVLESEAYAPVLRPNVPPVLESDRVLMDLLSAPN